VKATREAQPRVLVADDNDGVRNTTALILRAAGYHVDEAEDGEEALQRISAEGYDVAILDVRMPKRDGMWVVEHLDTHTAPKVLIDSAYDVGRTVRAHLGDRVFRYLRKPVPPAALLDAVRRAAAARRAQDGAAALASEGLFSDLV
jgi:CheY-like chemotaxis protein